MSLGLYLPFAKIGACLVSFCKTNSYILNMSSNLGNVTYLNKPSVCNNLGGLVRMDRFIESGHGGKKGGNNGNESKHSLS